MDRSALATLTSWFEAQVVRWDAVRAAVTECFVGHPARMRKPSGI
jgi:hypothetical protein